MSEYAAWREWEIQMEWAAGIEAERLGELDLEELEPLSDSDNLDSIVKSSV